MFDRESIIPYAGSEANEVLSTTPNITTNYLGFETTKQK
jgi:hypothetical protein